MKTIKRITTLKIMAQCSTPSEIISFTKNLWNFPFRLTIPIIMVRNIHHPGQKTLVFIIFMSMMITGRRDYSRAHRFFNMERFFKRLKIPWLICSSSDVTSIFRLSITASIFGFYLYKRLKSEWIQLFSIETNLDGGT